MAYLFQWVEQGRSRAAPSVPHECILEQARLARDRLVEGYQHFVIYTAKKYRRSYQSMELLDLISEGNLGLLRALDYHRPGEGYSLVTLIGRCVNQAILEGLYSPRVAQRDNTKQTIVGMKEYLSSVKAKKVEGRKERGEKKRSKLRGGVERGRNVPDKSIEHERG